MCGVASGQVGRPFIASAAVPADRVRLLRDAFNATVRDPPFVAETQKLRVKVFPSVSDSLSVAGALVAGPMDLLSRVARPFVWLLGASTDALVEEHSLQGVAPTSAQFLAMARGLASSPRLLMLDEPSMGLAPIILEKLLAVDANGFQWSSQSVVPDDPPILLPEFVTAYDL